MKKIIVTLMMVVSIASSQDFTIKKFNYNYDGDTVRVDLMCDTAIFCKNMSVRIKGVDTPELRTDSEVEKRLAKKAKKFTNAFMQDAIKLIDCEKGKYFRIVCDVENENGELLSKKLLNANLAVSYDGGEKTKSWKNLKK